MKTFIFKVICIVLLITNASCSTQQKMGDNSMYGTAWELEYISGPRITFDGLYPDKKPKITFDKETNKVSGTNSCNGYTADFTIKDKSIVFGEPGPSTMMFCGEGEQVFLNTMKKIDGYRIDADGKLNLMIGDIPMMRFKKSQ